MMGKKQKISALLCKPSYQYREVNGFTTCEKGRFVINLHNSEVSIGTDTKPTDEVQRQTADEVKAEQNKEIILKIESSMTIPEEDLGSLKKEILSVPSTVDYGYDYIEKVKQHLSDKVWENYSIEIEVPVSKGNHKKLENSDEYRLYKQIQKMQSDAFLIRGHSVNGRKGGSGEGYATALISGKYNSQHNSSFEKYMGAIPQNLYAAIPIAAREVLKNEIELRVRDVDSTGLYGVLFETNFEYTDESPMIPSGMRLTAKIVLVPNHSVGRATPFEFEPPPNDIIYTAIEKRLWSYTTSKDNALEWNDDTKQVELVIDIDITNIPLPQSGPNPEIQRGRISSTCDSELLAKRHEYIEEMDANYQGVKPNLSKNRTKVVEARTRLGKLSKQVEQLKVQYEDVKNMPETTYQEIIKKNQEIEKLDKRKAGIQRNISDLSMKLASLNKESEEIPTVEKIQADGKIISGGKQSAIISGYIKSEFYELDSSRAELIENIRSLQTETQDASTALKASGINSTVALKDVEQVRLFYEKFLKDAKPSNEKLEALNDLIGRCGNFSPPKADVLDSLLNIPQKNPIKELIEILKIEHSDVEVFLLGIHHAVKANNHNVIKKIAAAKGDLNVRDEQGNAPLHHAVNINELGTVRVLIENGADINATGANGYTPLHLAISQNRMDLVRELLEAKADLTIQDNQARTPLDHAIAQNRMDLVGVILKHDKGDPKIVDAQRQTLLKNAIAEKRLDLIQVLLKAGVDPNITDKDGYTPLYHAVFNKQHEVATQLLIGNANPNKTYGNGLTALHIAADKGDAKMASLLMQYGADPNKTYGNGFTALHRAADKGDAKMASLLMQHRADPNKQDSANQATPLHYAVKHNHGEVVRCLIHNKASDKIPDKHGATPRKMAENKPKIKQLLSPESHQHRSSGYGEGNMLPLGDPVPKRKREDSTGPEEKRRKKEEDPQHTQKFQQHQEAYKSALAGQSSGFSQNSPANEGEDVDMNRDHKFG
jgi:ankyrin repeat protein/predicted  nucleic acid-binding Zn-ribbon protein